MFGFWLQRYTLLFEKQNSKLNNSKHSTPASSVSSSLQACIWKDNSLYVFELNDSWNIDLVEQVRARNGCSLDTNRSIMTVDMPAGATLFRSSGKVAS